MADFVGNYVDDVRRAMIASLAAGQNLCLIGAPGGGKTSMARAMAERMLAGSSSRFTVTRITPAMQLTKLTGAVDGAHFFATGEYRISLEGTPYQDGNMIAVLDELWRGSDPVFDEALVIMDREDLPADKRPVSWVTANFVVDNERTQATIDRVGMTLWLPAGVEDAGAVARVEMASNGRATMPGWAPSHAEILAVRSWAPTAAAADAVATFVDQLAAEAIAAGRAVNKRTAAQWGAIAFRVSALYYGKNDFSQLHPEALAALALAWPSMTEADALEWQQLVRSLTNGAAVAAEKRLADHVGEFQRVAAIKDPAKRNTEAIKLGTALAQAQTELNELAGVFPGAPEIPQAIATLNTWFQNAVTGKSFEWAGGA